MSNNQNPKVIAVPESPEVTALREQLAKMKAEQEALVAKLKEQQSSTLSKVYFKVGEKGGVSVYGLQRFPITLFAEQWDTLLSDAVLTSLKAFIEKNRPNLLTKAQKQAMEADAKAKVEADNKAAVQTMYETVMVDGKLVTRRKATAA